MKGDVMGLAAEYDHFDQRFLVDPFGLWAQMREREPVARSDQHGGYYVVTRYDLIREAARDAGRFSSANGTGVPPLPIVGMIPIDIDPPDQREYRRILNPALGVDAVEAREPEVRAIVVELVDALVGHTEFDAGIELARLVPPRATLDFIGFPPEDWPAVIEAVEQITRLRGSDMEQVAQQGMVLMGACQRLLERRKTDPRTGDIMDLLLSGRFHGRELEDQEIVRMLAILLFGAIDTTSLAITGSLHYLAEHPEAQARLREEGVTKTAVEELVRYTSPVQGLGRTVTQDTELGGCPLRKDDRVMLMWCAANRDPAVFDDADALDVERRPNPHLGFGDGPHKCVGLNLGKLMLRITLEEFLARIGPFELADPGGVTWVGGETRGIRNLPLKVTG